MDAICRRSGRRLSPPTQKRGAVKTIGWLLLISAACVVGLFVIGALVAVFGGDYAPSSRQQLAVFLLAACVASA